MALNPLQFLVYPAALVCFWCGRRVALNPSSPVWLGILFFPCAIPALCFDLYYLHVWEEPIWLYRIRSWQGSELLAALAGFPAGWIQGRLRGKWHISAASVCLLLLAGLVIPYAKQLTGPLRTTERWIDGVCLQSTPSTCGPASAATLLTMLGVAASEAELAHDALSTWSGTENWYLRRAIQKRGVACTYIWRSPPVTDPPYPSIAGVRLGPTSGHFIAILRSLPGGGGYEIADPLYGRRTVKNVELQNDQIGLSGFFMVLGPPKE